MGVERTYDEFDRLKEIMVSDINKENAQEKLYETRIRMIDALKSLDVNNITEVEDFYLIVAQFNQAAGSLPGMFDDFIVIFIEAFKDHEKELQKIAFIESLYTFEAILDKPWAGVHRVCSSVRDHLAEERMLSVLNKTVPIYLNHLELKLKNSGGIPSENEKIPEDASSTRIKLINRYREIKELEHLIQDKVSLTGEEMGLAKNHIKTCIDNKPDWSEKSFLLKCADVLSLGLKPLYRAFFSKEKEIQNTLTESIEPPKM